MNVFGDSGGIDADKFLDYVAKQLPIDVAAIVKAKQEMAKRQGALTAVNDAHKLRDSAKAALEAAQDHAATILADARAEAAEASSKMAEQNAREAAMNAREAAFSASSASQIADLIRRESEVASRESTARADEANNATLQSQLQADRNALDSRIKAFQDKVAALNI